VVRSRGRLAAILLAAAFILAIGAAAVAQAPAQPAGSAFPDAGAKSSATLLIGDPTTLDPAAQGDLGSSIVISQLFEGLTAFDPGLNVRPALASSWEFLDGGRRIIFHLRPNLTFSDGTPIHGADVVRSWLRVVAPVHPSPLASLMGAVVGVDDYLAGRAADPATIGLSANGDDVEVRLTRPATDFPSVIASSTFAVVPAAVGRDPNALLPGSFVGSGAYVLAAATADRLTLRANEQYWAGLPSIATIVLRTSLRGASPVEAFEKGDVDYTPVSDFDASWITYDRILGPSLRAVPSLGVTYYGFDTSRPPFNDVMVRRAFAQAVDWKRLVTLAGPPSQVPATSMIPGGIPGHPQRDFGPAFDPAAARRALTDAGYANGSGFPDITLVTSGGAIDEAVISQLKENLGLTVRLETMESGAYFERLAADPPAFWSLTWAADYPGPNDFLGLLLGSGQSNNYGRWRSPEFDSAIADAGAAPDAATAEAAYDRAQTVVQRDAPVIPVAYGNGWALSRPGLLGSGQNGLGVPRLAGLAWGKP
jgi:ABC-type transport system substrate-binding protein